MVEELKFNRPMVVGREREYVAQVMDSTWMSGNGHFSKQVQAWMKSSMGLTALPTTSCTDALEMSALLCKVGPGDEVVVPSFTFVSTALAFALRGVKLVFSDSDPRFPHAGWDQIEPRLTSNTAAVVVVDYAGAGHDLDRISEECERRGLFLIEDAAQGIGSVHGKEKRWLGSFGDAATFSFHETKNLHCGEGGALLLNRLSWRDRAAILWEKGTNRKAFFEGLVDKYGWVDLGSSFLPNELSMAFLMGQLERMEEVNQKRLSLWNTYFSGLEFMEAKGKLRRQVNPPDGDHNGHMFYVLLSGESERAAVIEGLKKRGVRSAFHYQSLHRSSYIAKHAAGPSVPCPEADRFSQTLLRLPLHLAMEVQDCGRVIEALEQTL